MWPWWFQPHLNTELRSCWREAGQWPQKLKGGTDSIHIAGEMLEAGGPQGALRDHGHTVSFGKPGQDYPVLWGTDQLSWCGGHGLGFPFLRHLVSQRRGKTKFSHFMQRGKLISTSLKTAPNPYCFIRTVPSKQRQLLKYLGSGRSLRQFSHTPVLISFGFLIVWHPGREGKDQDKSSM